MFDSMACLQSFLERVVSSHTGLNKHQLRADGLCTVLRRQMHFPCCSIPLLSTASIFSFFFFLCQKACFLQSTFLRVTIPLGIVSLAALILVLLGFSGWDDNVLQASRLGLYMMVPLSATSIFLSISGGQPLLLLGLHHWWHIPPTKDQSRQGFRYLLLVASNK